MGEGGGAGRGGAHLHLGGGDGRGEAVGMGGGVGPGVACLARGRPQVLLVHRPCRSHLTSIQHRNSNIFL